MAIYDCRSVGGAGAGAEIMMDKGGAKKINSAPQHCKNVFFLVFLNSKVCKNASTTLIKYCTTLIKIDNSKDLSMSNVICFVSYQTILICFVT